MEVFAATSLGRRPWQDLPPELLGLVLQRIPSHAGRIRIGAVCRSWRASARMQPPLPPLLPLLLQRDDTFLSLPDGAVHRIPVPNDVSCLMSMGSELFLVHGDGRFSLFDPFSRDMALQYVGADCFNFQILSRDPIVYNVRKVVIMSNHIITVHKTLNQENRVISIRGRRQTTKTADTRWTPPIIAYSVDATLFQEKLYILARTSVGTIDLYVMDCNSDERVSLQGIISTPQDNMLPPIGHIAQRYLVASGDQLLMVRQEISKFNKKLMSVDFKVFEALDLSSGRAHWRKVNTLMGRALFISAGCSVSLPAGDQYAGAREDCIYFLSELGYDGLRQENISSGIYNIRDETLSPLPSEAVVAQDGPGTASWLFPTNT